MGLSDEERTGKILYCVREMIEKAEELKSEKSLDNAYPNQDKIGRLTSFCDSLWPSLIGGERNSAHWLLGSSSSNLVTDSNEDLWSVAVCSSLPQVREGKIQRNDFPDNEAFNPLKSMLSLANFLHHAERPCLQHICEIYELVETIIYALRRYNDKYLKDKKTFSDLIANIQGTCFSILYGSVDFTNCYIANQICTILYADHYRFKDDAAYKDVVDEWLHAQNMHHDITRVVGRSGENAEWLIQQHLILLGSEGIDIKKNRVLVALRMAGRRYHYEHNYKALLVILSKDKDLQDKAFLDEVAREFESCKKSHADYEESSRQEYKRDRQPHMLYGYDALPEKEEKIVEVEKPQDKKTPIKKTRKKTKKKI